MASRRASLFSFFTGCNKTRWWHRARRLPFPFKSYFHRLKPVNWLIFSFTALLAVLGSSHARINGCDHCDGISKWKIVRRCFIFLFSPAVGKLGGGALVMDYSALLCCAGHRYTQHHTTIYGERSLLFSFLFFCIILGGDEWCHHSVRVTRPWPAAANKKCLLVAHPSKRVLLPPPPPSPNGCCVTIRILKEIQIG